MDSEFNIAKLVRRNIRELKPYSSARDEFSGSASIFLDANESPFNHPLNRYPDPRQRELKTVIAGMRKQAVEHLFLGNGSDEGIDLLFRVFCEPAVDNVISIDPTYGMYGVCAAINQIEQRPVLLREDFSLDPQSILDAADKNTKLIFLCSPNNPTSNALEREAILEIIENAPCLVVVDEAYIDFSPEPGFLDLVPQKEKLVILQTLSKAYGLAGIRLGMLFGHPSLIHFLSAVKYPYNINSLTIETALKALKDKEMKQEWIRMILKERARLSKLMEGYSLIEKVFPSDANFLLVRVKHPKNLYQYLMDKGIIVRDRSSVALCEGCLRITVGLPEENDQLLEALSCYK